MSAQENTKSSMDVLLRGLWQENPVFIMLLGTCPTLAVTNKVVNCFAMGLSVLFVLVMSNLMISLLRNYIPKQVRIASFIVIIATFVTIVDYAIQTISLELYDSLGAFIQLIVVNCIILGRAEAFASQNTPFKSFLDGIGMGLAMTFVNVFAELVISLFRKAIPNDARIPIFIIVARRTAVNQVIGYLVLENGISVFGLAIVRETPALIELGVLMDVFVAVFVMGIAIIRINGAFDHMDSDRLTILKG